MGYGIFESMINESKEQRERAMHGQMSEKEARESGARGYQDFSANDPKRAPGKTKSDVDRSEAKKRQGAHIKAAGEKRRADAAEARKAEEEARKKAERSAAKKDTNPSKKTIPAPKKSSWNKW